MMNLRRLDWIVVVACLLLGFGCGGGCGGCGMTPIPGGFPSAKRTLNAGQVRVTSSGLAAVSSDPAALIGSLAGSGSGGVIQFNVPASCGGSTPVCCPGGVAQNPCGPINIDLSKHPGDSARLVLAPAQSASRLDVTVRTRIKTQMDIPVAVPLVGDCGIKIDTSAGSQPDVQIDVPITLAQDSTAGTTRVNVGTVALSNLETADVALTGSLGCQFASLGLSFFIDTLTSQLTGTVQSAIQDQTCKSCTTQADCGPFATACTGGTCMEGSQCLQELGLEGRLAAAGLFGGFSPGTTGAMDLYEVAGGYATTNNSGVALGLLGGMEPAGAPRDQCGPPSSAPAPSTIPQSTYFQGNTRPDTGAAFDIGIGLHKSQLAQLAYAGYNGGIFCLTVGHSTVSQLTTDTIGLLARSMGNLVESSAPVAVGLRPQSAPDITLGPNTFMTDTMGNKTLDQPLLDIRFTGLEIDFFVDVDDQYIRAFTIVADVHLPIGLQVAAMGKLTPVIGNPSDAFSNISVKNSDAITESPADLAATFPSLLSLALPQLAGGLGAISLPNLGGLALSVNDITSVDNNNFLAIYADLVPAMMARPVETTVDVTNIAMPPVEIAKHPQQWRGARPPAVTLALGGNARDLEWSYRIDDISWSAWSTNARPTIAPDVFWLPGVHHLDVRARQVGHPETIDETPARIEIPIGVAPAKAEREAPIDKPFHGQAGEGCTCATGGGVGGAAPFAVVIAFLLLPLRRLRRRAARLGATVWLAALACLPGCSCSNSPPCGGVKCMDGETPHAIGRWTSIAGDDQRVMVATYESVHGDLVAADVTDPANPELTVVDGIPTDATPTFDPGTYRGGISDAGPNVGAWTSIALANHGAMIAYQDRDALALKFAQENSGKWGSYVVDPGQGEAVGAYASLVIDGDGRPAIAYIAVGVDDGMGHRNTELRIARAATATPGSSDWGHKTIASAPGSCATSCDMGQSCIAGAAATDPQSCVVPSTDCSPACASGDVCSAATCHTGIPDPMLTDIPQGTGLYVSLLVMPDGRLAAVYYDTTRRALLVSVESAKGSSMFTETVLDGNVVGADRGIWARAVVGGDGTIHISYQDALGDELMYTTWSGTPGTPEVVDDGTRSGDRTHPVGAGATIYLVSGAPTIAYQDGLLSDVVIAQRGAPGSSWTQTQLATGPMLDGFTIASTTGHGAPVLAWDALDVQQSPVYTLVVKSP